MTKEEMYLCKGGAGLTATFLNAANQFLKTLYGFGQDLGSTIIRNIRKTYC